jgi:hypothetical protein
VIWAILQALVWSLLMIPTALVRRIMAIPVLGLSILERMTTLHLYYPLTVRRRRAAGQDEWQEPDWRYLGIHPPEGHPYWQQIARLETIQTPNDSSGDDA